MPSYRREGDLFTISYITGPRHVWLGIAFTDKTKIQPTIIKRPPVGKCSHGELDPERITEAVIAGLNGVGLYAERIEFVENDSPAYGLYEHCARLLAKRASQTHP